MVFSSAVFLLLFLPVVFILNTVIKTKYSNLLLVLASLVFYAWGEPVYILLMLASILLNDLIGRWIAKAVPARRRLALAVGIVFNIGILGYYKYAPFLISVCNRLLGAALLPTPAIPLPLGISFFTFQAISFLVDIYRGDAECPPRLLHTALYISFFPKLMEGPIVRYRDFCPQITERSVTWEKVSSGFRRFVLGLAKKMLIANVMGLCVDRIYAFGVAAIDTRAAWIAALAYAFQIYYDFSGYSDMAVGLGRMFGFELAENFDHPYLSRSVTEFWRRWHISLGAWFREYIYIPLGGNRRGTARTYLNLCIVFFLTGLWHGAAWSFIAWGLYHGFFCVIERMGLKKHLDKSAVLSRIYTFLVVTFGWVLFRTEGTLNGLRLWARMLLPWRYADFSVPLFRYADGKTLAVGVCAVLFSGILTALLPEKLREKWRGSVCEAIVCIVLLILSLAAIAGDTYNPFIYFQF